MSTQTLTFLDADHQDTIGIYLYRIIQNNSVIFRRPINNCYFQVSGIMPACVFFFLQLVSELAMHIKCYWLGGNPEQWVLRVLALRHCHSGCIYIPMGDFVGMVLNPWNCLSHSCYSYWLTGSRCFKMQCCTFLSFLSVGFFFFFFIPPVPRNPYFLKKIVSRGLLYSSGENMKK